MKSLISVLCIFFLLLVVGCVQHTQPLVEKESFNAFTETFAQSHHLSPRGAQTILKKTFGVEDWNDTLARLPKPTPTFNEDKAKLYNGNAGALADIPLSSYIQPEFYPTYETTGKKMWETTPTYQPSATGIASTPAVQEATLTLPGTEFETTLFIGASWGVTEYQGVALDAIVKPEAPITVVIEPKTMLLGPSFPLFSPEWMRKITIHGHVDPTTAPGTYIITIRLGKPDQHALTEWSISDKNIVPGDTTFSDPEGLATLTLHVKEKN